MTELKQELKILEELKSKVRDNGGNTIEIFKDSLNDWLKENLTDPANLEEIVSILKREAPVKNRVVSKRGITYITKPTTCIDWKKFGYERSVIASAFRQLRAGNKNLDGKTHYAIRI